MKELLEKLQGTDLRSIGHANEIAAWIHTQAAFDDLFDLMFHKERTVAMRAADALEKITTKNPSYLRKHRQVLLGLLIQAENIEVKWHVALMVSRLKLPKTELQPAWDRLKELALQKNESRIVRVNALQALHDLLPQCGPAASAELLQVTQQLLQENIPSIKARVKRLHSRLGQCNN